MHEYDAIIRWSADDGAFVAEVPELPGCMAHGATREEARKRIAEAMTLWIETAREFGDPVPPPKRRAATARDRFAVPAPAARSRTGR